MQKYSKGTDIKELTSGVVILASGVSWPIKKTDLGWESTPTIAIYYYYSAWKLIFILPSHW